MNFSGCDAEICCDAATEKSSCCQNERDCCPIKTIQLDKITDNFLPLATLKTEIDITEILFPSPSFESVSCFQKFQITTFVFQCKPPPEKHSKSVFLHRLLI
jgi:hypothetical protein